ncbi:MAG: flagellar export protein FliJ [Betaproteobacteria bacterium]
MNSRKRMELWGRLETDANNAWHTQLSEVERVKNSLEGLRQNVGQLTELRKGYQEQISQSSNETIDQFKFIRIREFLSALDRTLDQARNQEKLLSESLQKAQHDSKLLMLQKKKYGYLKEKHQKTIQKFSLAQEQRDLDQLATRGFNLNPETP